MKAIILFMFLILAECPGNPFRCAEHEPSYFAEIEKKPTVGKIILEVTFNQRLSECVNGVENTDFAWTKVQVGSPAINGVTLKTSEGANGKIYTAESVSELGSYDLSFSLNGRTYRSDWTTAEIREKATRVSMKQEQPETEHPTQ
jgi:hypothetical protein